MAIANTKSTEIANLEASPPVANDRLLAGGRVRKKVATIEVAAADDDGSVYRLFRVHSGWHIHSIRILNDAITGGTAFDVGLYGSDDGAAVDDDAYASAVDLSSANVSGAEVAFEARNIDDAENKVWQDAGAAADGKTSYDLCLTGDTVGTAAGTITAILEYTGD
ncbi:MAG: hypothetical protein GY791_08325 [Alphaproteobacteria bacterium]|nr:hypothetical protein [Alphaproteobacteria bacterium]